jgi:hypothetical protein
MHDINAISVIAFPALQGIFSDRFSVPRFALKLAPLALYPIHMDGGGMVDGRQQFA